MKKILATTVLSLIFAWSPISAQAANLYSSFSPDSTSGIFILDILASSTDENINAVSGTISFPKDMIEVSSISRDNSDFDLWMEEPSFSNDDGIVSFEAISLNQTLTENNVISITFKVKKNGFVPIYFSSGSVLADDGKGTDILEELNSNSFLIR